ncbi:oxaloacetate decarboxylase gamma chain [Oceanicoccus sagamiensis]|uniref:Probable oxaloacetate decarboxylase gamma chain n=2 Tax=Oceanicoccus sagamiensis TaxID=716816 RepID=A0A1X9NHC6_9GAMM|nr:OadG family transporter subunit [Oceanicoccus sagamiensis]ARN76394.1 oxaloacetate decarboxylase gamma chain [Oceanicoccus sagamiensis]
MQDLLLQQGVELMLYGMGTVFTFLVLLIVATTLMSAVLQRFVTPEPAPAVATKPVAPAANDEQLVAVISAAIHKYRSKNK